MDARGAVRRLLELHRDTDADWEAIEARLDDTAIELLTALCKQLALALAAAQCATPGRALAREHVSECTSAIGMVLEVWEMADVEVVGGTQLDDALGRVLDD